MGIINASKVIFEDIKPLGILGALIIVCTALSKVFGTSETLEEYAERIKAEKAAAETVDAASQTTETSSDKDNGEIIAKEQESLTTSEAASETADRAATLTEDIIRSFYYEPLSDEIIDKITGISYIENDNVTLDELRYLHILHYNFEGTSTEGELICNEAIAQDLLEIFYELYKAEYKIEKVRLIDEYEGDDTASMEDNNTSCFNYRVVDGSDKLSKHAYGLAIDINPFYNPYVVFQSDGSTYISPKGSEGYTDRSADFPYKIDENDLCYKLFKEHGFTWGGDWNSCKDYQHFQKN